MKARPWSDDIDLDDSTTTCFICTFDNPVGSAKCEMCSSDLSYIRGSGGGNSSPSQQAAENPSPNPSGNVWLDALGVATAWIPEIPFAAVTPVEAKEVGEDGRKPATAAASTAL